MSGAREPRTGLQRRYTMEEILEHGGKAKIQPLNYDALAMLRNPLYVKFAQELKDRSSEMNRGILAKQTEDAAVRQLTSDNDLPHTPLKEVIQRAPETDPHHEFFDGDEYGDSGTARGLAAAVKGWTRKESAKREHDGKRKPGGSSGTPPAGGSSGSSPAVSSSYL